MQFEHPEAKVALGHRMCNQRKSMGHDLKLTSGTAEGAWIERRLGGEFGAVTLHVPHGYESYARIFHPALDSERNPVRWADVADFFGTTPHREMQWHAILGFSDADELSGSYEPHTRVGSKWPGHDPRTGGMDPHNLDALCEILKDHSRDPTRCCFGLCTIESWEEAFSADELEPLLKLHCGRNYIVLTGPLSAVDQIVRDWSRGKASYSIFLARMGGSSVPDRYSHAARRNWFVREAPNLIWPADHSWFVASEVDFDSTLVGGSAELIEAIVESSELEAWRVEPTDSLAADADKVNRPLRGG